MATKLTPEGIIPELNKRMPFKNNIRFLLAASFIIALIVGIVSVVGIKYQQNIYQTESLVNTFVPNDIINLLIGLPFMLISLLLVLKGKLTGLLCWPGALFYFMYVYFPYIICVPISFLTILYLIIFSSSIYTLIGVIVNIDGNALDKQMSDTIPVKILGGILTAMGILIIIRQTVLFGNAIINDKRIVIQELAVLIDDFAFGSPALIICGVLLWNKKSLGYIIAPGLYLVNGILSVGLIPFMIIQSHLKNVSLDILSIGVLFIMSVICIVPFIIIRRGFIKS